MSGVPSACVPVDRYGRNSTPAVPSWAVVMIISRPTSRPGTLNVPYGWPAAAPVSATAPSHSTRSCPSRMTRSGAGANPFWWNV